MRTPYTGKNAPVAGKILHTICLRFTYETSISIFHEAFAAPCIDGDAEHDWKETRTIPRCFRKLRCSVCGEEKEIEGIEEERKAYLAELGKR